MEKLVRRRDKIPFMDVSTTSVELFKRMRRFTEFSTNKNAQEYSRTYIDEDGETTDVTGYSEEKSYGFDQYTDNPVHEKIVDITENEKTGNDALVKILVVDKTKPIDNGYKARLRTYAVIPDTDGDDTNAYTYSGTLRKNTAFTVGKAVLSENEQTATFTPIQEAEEYPVTFIVKDSAANTPIAEAKITIEDASYLTDATGIVTVVLQAKAYSTIKVEKDGYTTQEDISVTVSTSAVLKEISLVEA